MDVLIGRRFISVAMILGTSATACTAIILSNLDEAESSADGGSRPDSSGTSSGSSSSTSGAAAGECDLLRIGSSDQALPGNDCATCIQSECESHVTKACNDVKGQSSKEWFQTMKTCAQHPFEGYPDPSPQGSSSNWGCRSYLTPDEEITGDPESDTQKKYESQKCIHDNCLQGDRPPCKKCEVSHEKGVGSERQLLAVDKCGKCFSNCRAGLLVQCCSTAPMQDYVEYCAYTFSKTNLQRCVQIADAGVEDSGWYFEPGHSYDDFDNWCAHELGECFLEHCKGESGCAVSP